VTLSSADLVLSLVHLLVLFVRFSIDHLLLQTLISIANNDLLHVRAIGSDMSTLTCREAQAIAKRFAKHGQAYFQFISTPGIEPTKLMSIPVLGGLHHRYVRVAA